MKRLLLIIIFLVILNSFQDLTRLRNKFGMTIYAAPLKSDTYIIKPGKKDETTNTIQKSIVPDIAISQEEKPFRFTLSSDILDFGPLSPTNPSIRYLTISIVHDSLFPYTLFAFEDHPLKAVDHAQCDVSDVIPATHTGCEDVAIPDTSCDTGTCNQKESAIWINPLTFGFGYTFDDTNYKRFANLENNESWQDLAEKTDVFKLTAKLNVSRGFETLARNASPVGSDAGGKIYQNTVTFIAIPKL